MQEMTMVERVSWGIREAEIAWFSEKYPDLPVEEIRNGAELLSDCYKMLAIAAIETMREPTDSMLGAFDRMTDDSGSVLVKTGYRAMIDAALSE